MASCLLYKTREGHVPQPGKAESCTGLRSQWSWGVLFTVRQMITLAKEGALVKTLWAYYLGRALWKAFFCKQHIQKFGLVSLDGWRRRKISTQQVMSEFLPCDGHALLYVIVTEIPPASRHGGTASWATVGVLHAYTHIVFKTLNQSRIPLD